MPVSADYNPKVCGNLTAVIAISTTTSAEVDLLGTSLAGIHMPSVFQGTTLKFSTALKPEADGGTHVVMQDGAGADYSVTVTTSKYIPVDLAKFAGVRFVKIISGTSESGGARTLGLATRPI